MEIKEKTAFIEGKVFFKRKSPDEKTRCICCKDGIHIYQRYIEVEPRKSLVYAGIKMASVDDFLHECLHLMPDVEGKKVRVTLEIID